MSEKDMDEPRGDDAAFLDGAPGEAVRDAIRADPVPPLDELTRRRLVSRALDEHVVGTPGRGRGPWLLGAAAAAVLVLVGTTVVLANRGGDGTGSDRAGDATVAEEERDEPAAAPEADQGAADQEELADEGGTGGAAEPGAPIALGDLGSFTDVSELDPRIEAALAASTTRTPALLQELAAGPCAPVFGGEPELTIEAAGTASFEGRRAIVVVGRDDAGRTGVGALITDVCELLPGSLPGS